MEIEIATYDDGSFLDNTAVYNQQPFSWYIHCRCDFYCYDMI